MTNPSDSGANRSFGLTFCLIFAVVGLWPLAFNAPPRWWALIVSLIIALMALLAPALLSRPRQAWSRFALLLQRIVNPILLGVLFVAAFLPTALYLRARRRLPLKLKRANPGESYWREPDARVVSPESFKHLY